MKTLPLLATLLLALTFGISTLTADDSTAPAVTAAKGWLTLIDNQEYAKSWEEAAPFFKDSVPQSQWETMIALVRTPLGKVESREFIAAQPITSLPDAPEGEYVVIQFKTRFADKPDSVETIVPMKSEGVWRVSGYFIK